ncbi:hypothetical protein HDV05_004921 [Chytridiales sp. JEL 0842]|nr:hypothetical protein HDV05_004921 [Chytridiales sp. JEL 0842]
MISTHDHHHHQNTSDRKPPPSTSLELLADDRSPRSSSTESAAPQPPLTTLPYDLRHTLLAFYLAPVEAARLGATCKALNHSIMKDERLWKTYCVWRFRVPPQLNLDKTSWNGWETPKSDVEKEGWRQLYAALHGLKPDIWGFAGFASDPATNDGVAYEMEFEMAGLSSPLTKIQKRKSSEWNFTNPLMGNPLSNIGGRGHSLLSEFLQDLHLRHHPPPQQQLENNHLAEIAHAEHPQPQNDTLPDEHDDHLEPLQPTPASFVSNLLPNLPNISLPSLPSLHRLQNLLPTSSLPSAPHFSSWGSNSTLADPWHPQALRLLLFSNDDDVHSDETDSNTDFNDEEGIDLEMGDVFDPLVDSWNTWRHSTSSEPLLSFSPPNLSSLTQRFRELSSNLSVGGGGSRKAVDEWVRSLFPSWSVDEGERVRFEARCRWKSLKDSVTAAKGHLQTRPLNPPHSCPPSTNAHTPSPTLLCAAPAPLPFTFTETHLLQGSGVALPTTYHATLLGGCIMGWFDPGSPDLRGVFAGVVRPFSIPSPLKPWDTEIRKWKTILQKQQLPTSKNPGGAVWTAAGLYADPTCSCAYLDGCVCSFESSTGLGFESFREPLHRMLPRRRQRGDGGSGGAGGCQAVFHTLKMRLEGVEECVPVGPLGNGEAGLESTTTSPLPPPSPSEKVLKWNGTLEFDFSPWTNSTTSPSSICSTCLGTFGGVKSVEIGFEVFIRESACMDLEKSAWEDQEGIPSPPLDLVQIVERDEERPKRVVRAASRLTGLKGVNYTIPSLAAQRHEGYVPGIVWEWVEAHIGDLPLEAADKDGQGGVAVEVKVMGDVVGFFLRGRRKALGCVVLC